MQFSSRIERSPAAKFARYAFTLAGVLSVYVCLQWFATDGANSRSLHVPLWVLISCYFGAATLASAAVHVYSGRAVRKYGYFAAAVLGICVMFIVAFGLSLAAFPDLSMRRRIWVCLFTGGALGLVYSRAIWTGWYGTR